MTEAITASSGVKSASKHASWYRAVVEAVYAANPSLLYLLADLLTYLVGAWEDAEVELGRCACAGRELGLGLGSGFGFPWFGLGFGFGFGFGLSAFEGRAREQVVVHAIVDEQHALAEAAPLRRWVRAQLGSEVPGRG